MTLYGLFKDLVSDKGERPELEWILLGLSLSLRVFNELWLTSKRINFSSLPFTKTVWSLRYFVSFRGLDVGRDELLRKWGKEPFEGILCRNTLEYISSIPSGRPSLLPKYADYLLGYYLGFGAEQLPIFEIFTENN